MQQVKPVEAARKPEEQGCHPVVRLRRLRYHAQVRRLVRQTVLTLHDLVQPVFVKAGQENRQAIKTMPGQYQWGLDQLPVIINTLVDRGIAAVFLFGIPETKDNIGSSAWLEEGIIQQAIRRIKQLAPHLLVIADLCFCEYTDHGHCGALTTEDPKVMDVDNDLTLTLLQKQAISLAQAGADVLAPSGMMDGVVRCVRLGLDQAGYTQVGLWSYAVKYASSLYYPFREAAEAAPRSGDRATYQMDPGCSDQALREASLDVAEGADALIVKPAHTYLDVLHRVKSLVTGVPVGAYHVSGEYAMLKAAAAAGHLVERQAVMEILLSIKRAGADFIVTYYANEAASWL